MPGYKDWIDAIDIKVDYFSAFMKAWIAFNAWYNFSGEVTGNSDKECIEYIASQSNRFKTYTMNLINAEDADGSAYRENIAKLHGSLLDAAITTQEYIGVRQSVSFAEVAVKNANTLKRKDYYQHHYECSRAHGKTKTAITVKTTGVSVFCFEQDGYDIDVLRQQSGFIGLTQRQKEQCEECYRELTPYRITSVLESGQATKQIGAYNFVNDAEKISEAIVIILYMLRCCLAHGDISPDESANEVYKYAYEVLCAPLRKLKLDKNLCWGLNQPRFLFFSYKRLNRATYPTSTYYRKLITSFLPNPSANACKVATVGLQEPLSMRLILD